MPESLRSLLVILILAIPCLYVLRFATTSLISSDDFARRRNLWLALTFTAFAAHNFWLCMFVSAALLFNAWLRERNPLAVYFFVMFCIPPLNADIPGLGFNYLFGLDFLRLLSLVVLLPAAFRLLRDDCAPRPGSCLADKLLLGYILYSLFLIFLAGTFTNLLRSVFILSLDILLPYYVASRSLRRFEDFREALTGLVIGACLLALLGIFESSKGWLLYSPLKQSLGVDNGILNYLLREETYRAMGSAGHPIALGFVMVVALGLWFHLQRLTKNRWLQHLPLLLLAGGAIATFSRGPWVGALAMLLIHASLGPRPVVGMLRLGVLGLLAAGLTAILPGGERLIDMLPFVGGTEGETVRYRQQLIEIMVPIILDNPFLGASSYLFSPAVEALRQGQGIIDVVNTYIGIGLRAGLIGLSLFVGTFIAVIINIWRRMRREDNIDARDLGRTLVAVLIAVLVILATVSSITVLPFVYWALVGTGTAYAFGMTRRLALSDRSATPEIIAT